MNKVTLNFFGEIVSVEKPTNLSDLRNEICNVFLFTPQDASEIVLTYNDNDDQITISNENDYKTFLDSKVDMIELNISQQSQIYKENLNKIQEENSKDKALLEELLKKKEEFKNMKETKFASEKKEIEDIKSKIVELRKRKMEIKNKICSEMKKIWDEKMENDKKIAELQKKLGLPVTVKEHHRPHEFKMSPFHHKHHHNMMKMKFMQMAQPHPPFNPFGFNKGFRHHPKGPFGMMNFNTINDCPKTERKEKKDIHFFIICDGCGMRPLVGKRYKCKECNDFDYCEKCYEKNKDTHKHEFTLIEKPERKEKKDVHFFIICDGCGIQPLVGKRYKCKGCKDFDYCEKCYEKNKDTHKHEFTLIEKPEMRNPFMPTLNLSFGEHPRHHFFHHHRPHFQDKKEKKEEKNEIIENSRSKSKRHEKSKSKSRKHGHMPRKMEHFPTMGNIFQDNKISDKVVHFGVKCDGCGVFPIVGCRYKCAFCDNFDYCEQCESKLSGKHNHPFLKIYEPKMKPVFFKCYQKK